MVLGECRPKYFDIQMVRGESCSIYLVERSSSSNSTIYSIVLPPPPPNQTTRIFPETTPPTDGPPVVPFRRTFRCLTRSAWGVIGGSQVADSGFTNLSARSLVFWKKVNKGSLPTGGASSSPHLTRAGTPQNTNNTNLLWKKKMSFQLSWEDRNLMGGVSHSRLTIASANWPSWIEKGYKLDLPPYLEDHPTW